MSFKHGQEVEMMPSEIEPHSFRADQAPRYIGGGLATIVCYAAAILFLPVYYFVSRGGWAPDVI